MKSGSTGEDRKTSVAEPDEGARHAEWFFTL